MTSIADYDRSALDRSLNPALDFMASHPVYRDVGVKSGRRNKASNRSAGGAKKSQHLLGKALDLDVSRLSNAQKAQLLSDLAGYGIKGIGIYDNNNIHIDARKNFATWGANRKNKYAGVDISQQPKWARPALTAIQQAGPYKAFPAAPAAQLGETGLGPSPSGASLADVYGKAQYQRAMPPSLPVTAPQPSVRPGGLGTLRLDANQSMAPSVMQAAYGQWARPMAEDTLSRMVAGQNMPVTAEPSSFPGRPPGPVGAMPAARPQSSFPGRPAEPVGTVSAQSMPTPTPRPDYASPQQRMAPTVSDVMRSPVSPVGPYAAATGPVASPAAITADRVAATPMQAVENAPMGLVGTNMPVGPANAPPAALDAARQLGAAVATLNTPAAALNPDRVKDDVVANTPAAAAQTLTETPEIAFDTPAAVPARTPAQAAVRAQAATQPQGIPGGLAGPWGADIANQPALDRMTTQTTTVPTTFGQKLGNFAQRNIPAIAGSLIGGPVGGLIGGVLGLAIDNAQPGQMLGNPFQGLGGSLKAMGMFQSGQPYAGPTTHYGTGLRAISDVLGGNAPVGSRAYSRSTPGYSVTSLPNGMVQRTNQYGFTSFERPSMGPTAASFPGGFSGWGGGGFFGGTGRKTEKTEKGSSSFGGGRTSGGGRQGGGNTSTSGKIR